jgi:hypothetical protein
MTTTIAQQVSSLVQTIAAQPPNEVMGAFAQEQASLAAKGVPEGVIEVGATLPDADMVDPHGVAITLYEALSEQVAVLVLYRGPTFTVLSDPANQVAKAIGILTAPSAEALAAQLELGLDLTAVNADGTTGLPMPTTIILDADHVVCWRDVHPDYTTRSEPDQILAALDAVASR